MKYFVALYVEKGWGLCIAITIQLRNDTLSKPAGAYSKPAIISRWMM
jgi:hypothetical protein